MSTTNNCRNLFYCVSHVLREFNDCYGFFENKSLCNYLDEELKHCLLFYHINDDNKESIIKWIEYNLLKLNPIKYASMVLNNNITPENDNNLLLTIIYFSTTITLSPASIDRLPTTTNDSNISSIITHAQYGYDTLTLHSICHCIDYENIHKTPNISLIKTIHEYLGKTHYDPYFDRLCLTDKAVQFSTLRLHTNRQMLLNRLWSCIGETCLSNAFFERNVITPQLIKSLLSDSSPVVIARIIHSLIVGPMHPLCATHPHLCNSDDKDKNNEILSLDLQWEKDCQYFDNSDEILFEILSVETFDNSENNNLDTFIQYVIQNDLDWKSIWKCLDDPHILSFDYESLLKLTKISISYENVLPFVRECAHSSWDNKECYFNIVRNSLNSLDKFNEYNSLLSLSSSNLYLQIRALLKKCIDVSPDVVIYGIIQSDMGCALKHEILDGILPTYLYSKNEEIKMNQYSILCHSDQYLFCKYIRHHYNHRKIGEIADIFECVTIHTHAIKILTPFITIHSHSLSFPILLSLCLYNKAMVNAAHIRWFISNALKKGFYDTLINLINTVGGKKGKDQGTHEYIKLVFAQLFKHKHFAKKTQITFLKFLLLSKDYSMIDSKVSQCKEEDIAAMDMQTLRQLGDFEMGILLLVIYMKCTAVSAKSSMRQYLASKWGNYYRKYILLCSNTTATAATEDPLPLIDIIRENDPNSGNIIRMRENEQKQRLLICAIKSRFKKIEIELKQKLREKRQKKERRKISKKDADQIVMDRISHLLSTPFTKDNRLIRFNDIRIEIMDLERETHLLHWFARLLVHRCSTDFECQQMYVQLLEYIANRELFESVINLTYEAINSLLSSSTIDEQSQQRMILRGLGSWVGKLTIGRTRPLLQKRLNLGTLIVRAYEENRLIVVIPFVSKILESTIGNSIFCPPNPWLMSVLSLIAELHIYVEKLAVTYEIEQLFQHLNISAKSIEPTNVIRQQLQNESSAAESSSPEPGPQSIVAIEDDSRNGAIDFSKLKTRIPNLVSYVKIPSAVHCVAAKISNFIHIIAHGFDRCVCEIVPICVERSIDVACICSRELVLKDTISEVSASAIRKSANQMVSTLSGALTLVICREPIKQSAVQQMKKCLKEAGVSLSLIAAINVVLIVDRNLDLVCNMAEKLAADRATKILEHNLGSLFSSRSSKTHPIPYNSDNIRMQRRVYEDFDTIRSMLRASCRHQFTEWNLIYTKFQEKFAKFEHSRVESNTGITELLLNDIADLLSNLLSDSAHNSDKKSETFQFLIAKMHQFEHTKNKSKTQNALFMILAMVRDKNKLFCKQFTKAWLRQKSESALSKSLLFALLDYHFFVLDDIDKYVASLVLDDAGGVIDIAVQMIRVFVLGRKFSLTDFKAIHHSLHCHSSLLKIQQLFTELEEQIPPPPLPPPPPARYINYQTRVIDLLRKSFSIKGSSANQVKMYKDFINNEMAQFLASQQSIARFLEVSIKIVIGKCTEDLKNVLSVIDAFGTDLKDVIDAFGKLVVSCIKRIDIDISLVMTTTFFECIRADIENRIKSKPLSLFNQRPYLRLIVFVLFELSEMTYVSALTYPRILLTFARFLSEIKPEQCAQFTFAWIQLLSHCKFMPKILIENEESTSDDFKKCKEIFHDLLMSLLRFVDPFWRSPKSPPSVCLLFQGTLRILLVLLHDFPSFLCEYHFSFCESIPISSFQMRNLVLSAFPKNTQLPDPFQPNLNLQSIPEMDKEPKLSSDYMRSINAGCQALIDTFEESKGVKQLSQMLHYSNQTSNNEGFVIRYNLSLVNSIIVYLCGRARTQKKKCLDLIYFLALELDAEGRYHLFNAVCNNLRYPNSHTKFCSEAILFMFKKSNVIIKEQITRILLERLVVHRPHPWGLLITFIQLIKQPQYKFWDEPFTRCAPEIESLFQTVASSCFRVFN